VLADLLNYASEVGGDHIVDLATLTGACVVALGDGVLYRDVPVLSHDELGELARAFNAMAAKLRVFRAATTAKVLRAQRTMEATLTSTPDPVFVVSRTGNIELRNPAAEMLARVLSFYSSHCV